MKLFLFSLMTFTSLLAASQFTESQNAEYETYVDYITPESFLPHNVSISFVSKDTILELDKIKSKYLSAFSKERKENAIVSDDTSADFIIKVTVGFDTVFDSYDKPVAPV